MKLLAGDTPQLRKTRGAFFTPPAIADFLAEWAVGGKRAAHVLDPTSGEGVFLRSAGQQLRALGATSSEITAQLHGVDVHQASLDETRLLLDEDGLAATLRQSDFFEVASPDQLVAGLPWMDAVIGNPPFVRYQEHRGEARKRSVAAALRQGVRLSGLASSWAALLVHACSFLQPDGRVAMVVPKELLTVGYAEPIRRWLSERFAAVHLVLFDQLQFADAEEQVMLLVARGSGGCGAMALHQVNDAADLTASHLFDAEPVVFGRPEDKWTDLLLPLQRRSRFRALASSSLTSLSTYGSPALGTVTGANHYFAINEATRTEYGISTSHLRRIVPPGSRHAPGLRFTRGRWQQLKADGHRVWLLHPDTDHPTGGLARYLEHGLELGIDSAYKCTVRDPWWRPPIVTAPDLFFTYMSDVTPRLITNDAGVTIVNSLHGLRLADDVPGDLREALPLLAFNSATMLGAELYGRPYGGGILKMEPREAGTLPVPSPTVLTDAWNILNTERSRLDRLVRAGHWSKVVEAVDKALLVDTIGMSPGDARELRDDAASFRRRRRRYEA